MNAPIYDKSLNYKMYQKIYKIIVTTFLYSLFLLTAHATTLYGEHVNSIVYGKHYEKKLQGRWHVYMNGKPVLDKHGKPITYDYKAQPGTIGFDYKLKGSSADEKMSFGNGWMFILTLLFCFSCSRKKPMNYLFYGNEEHLEWIMVEPVYSNGKSFFNKNRIKDSIDDEDLPYINKIIKRKMESIEGVRPFNEYFKQYIAYKEKGRKMVYVNIFEYIPIVNGLTPHVYRKIIKINGENYASGYMIIDYSTGKITECKFDE